MTDEQIDRVAWAILDNKDFAHHGSFLTANEWDMIKDEMRSIARDAIAAMNSGWQPIETAVKDDELTRIDLWVISGVAPAENTASRETDCFWYPNEDYDPEDEDEPEGRWFTVDGPVIGTPTHWMPTPEPPTPR